LSALLAEEILHTGDASYRGKLVDIVVAFALSEMDNNELTNIPLLKSFPWLGKDHFSFVES